MFQHKETKGKGSETTPKFYNGMQFYSPTRQNNQIPGQRWSELDTYQNSGNKTEGSAQGRILKYFLRFTFLRLIHLLYYHVNTF